MLSFYQIAINVEKVTEIDFLASTMIDQNKLVKSRVGKFLTKEGEVRKRWQNHRPDPETTAEIRNDSDYQ